MIYLLRCAPRPLSIICLYHILSALCITMGHYFICLIMMLSFRNFFCFIVIHMLLSTNLGVVISLILLVLKFCAIFKFCSIFYSFLYNVL